MKKIIASCLLSLLLPSLSEAMSLDDYLNQVSAANSEVRYQKQADAASRLRASEGRLLTSVNFYSSAKTSADRKQAQNPAFEGTARNQNVIEVGLEQPVSALGLNHRLYFAVDEYELIGVDPSFINQPKVTRSSANYEFTLPVWRNAFGKNARLQRSLIEERNLSGSLSSRFETKRITANAISIYWRLKASQENLVLVREMLKANEDFLHWTKRRVSERLSENADLKQAEAAVALKKFELQSAEAELIEATQAFNRVLERDLESPVGNLDAFPSKISKPAAYEAPELLTRDDLLSLQAALKVQNAEAKIAAENTKPSFDLTGFVSSNGLDARMNPSISESFTGKYPSSTIGFRFSVPLDRTSVDKVQRSVNFQSDSLESQLRRRQFEVKAEYEALNKNLDQAIRVRELAVDVEQAQLAKYRVEQDRHRTGRTSTFQLLSFQQDYQQARQSLIRAQSAAFQLRAQYIVFEKVQPNSLLNIEAQKPVAESSQPQSFRLPNSRVVNGVDR